MPAAITLGVMVLATLATLALGRAQHLRVLVPSWRFFDRADAPPSLWVERARGTWEQVTPPRRGPLGWAFAPASNLALAYQATVDRLVAEVSELAAETPDDDPAITALRSYAIVTAIAREGLAVGVPFRWRIVSDDADFLTSGEHTA